MKQLLRLVGLLGLLVLGACGGGAGSGFSGTVTAPVGMSVENTTVVACFYVAAIDDCDESKSKNTVIRATGRSGDFSIDGLAPGDYLIFATKTGLFGFYADARGEAILVKPPRSGINIQLEAATSLGQARFWRVGQ